MRDYLLVYMIAGLLAVSSGCAMCASEHDCTYSAFGGLWQRGDPCCGRVGSAFDPADVQIVETEVLPEGQIEEVPPEGESVEGVEEIEGEQDSVLRGPLQ